MPNNILQRVDSCNGEIRMQACRYGIGWMCVVLLTELDSEEDDLIFNEMFYDMIAGDNDYFEARDYFEANEKTILAYGETPALALASALGEGNDKEEN